MAPAGYGAWYLDRDNSMEPAEPEVGDAMFLLTSKNGKTQAVQVCEGVFLATAHGALNLAEGAEQNGRPLGDPYNQRIKLYPYPVTSRQSLQVADLDVDFFSPRLENPALWDDRATDYVFIRFDPAAADTYARENEISYSSQSFVPIAMATAGALIQASSTGETDVHLYRGRTRFNTDENGVPDFDRNTWAIDFIELMSIYREPQKVEQACNFRVISTKNHVATDCPIESSVSGSPLITDGPTRNIVAIATRTQERVLDDFSFQNGGSQVLTSNAFCADYERVCGRPCSVLENITR